MKDEIKYLAEPFAKAGDPFFDGMTAKQRQITGLVLCGNSNRHIAQTIGASESTVRSHISHIYDRLEVSSREDMIGQYFGPPEMAQLQAIVLRHRLTEQETKILIRILRGETSEEAADALSISSAKLRGHMANMFKKLGISSKDEAFVAVHGYVHHPRPVSERPTAEVGNPFFNHMTSRERQITGLALCGNSNKHIARAVGISEGTVKSHISNIFGKLGVSRREDMLARHFGTPDQEQLQDVALKYGLTRQEKNVLAQVLTGKDTLKIADDLVIGVGKLKIHVSNIFKKLGIASKDEAFVFVHSHDIPQPSLTPEQHLG